MWEQLRLEKDRIEQARLLEKQKLEAERLEEELKALKLSIEKSQVQKLETKIAELNQQLLGKQTQLEKVETENNDLKKHYISLRTSAEQLKKESEKLKTDLQQVNNKPDLSKIQQSLEQSKLENQQLKAALNHQRDDLVDLENKVDQPNLQDFFYMSIPSTENVFSNDNRSDYYQSNRIFYRFFVFNNGEALFEFCNEPQARDLALEKPHTHILSACVETNQREKGVKHIRTLARGKAVLKDNLWKVFEKAKIEYIY